jgi:hypothetical protein
MINGGVGAFEVYVGSVAVHARGFGVFESKLKMGDRSGAGLALAEAFLGIGEEEVCLGIIRGHLSEQACPQLI